MLLGCERAGQIEDLQPAPASIPLVEQQSIQRLSELYQMAIVQEDIDRLQAILAGNAATMPTERERLKQPAKFESVTAFRERLTRLFLLKTVRELKFLSTISIDDTS